MIPTSRAATPLVPDADEARQWLTDELSKPEYQAAQPTAFDLAMQAISDWFVDLLAGATGVPGPVLTLIVVVVVAVLVIVAFLVFGLPRLRRARSTTVPLFDDGDLRDLAALRRAAVAAAGAGDWPLAIEERFRAIVRGLVDRDLVQVHPGTTARGFADAATRRFPEHAVELRAAAASFEGVRYLGRPGDAADYERATALEGGLAAARSAESDTPAGASPGIER